MRTPNSIWEDRVRSAVDQALQSKGLQQVPDNGDIRVSAIAIEAEHADLQTFYNGGWGMGWGWRGWRGGPWFTETVPVTCPVGTLVLDLFDQNSKELVFRGSASDTISSGNPAKNDKKLDDAAMKLVDKLKFKKD